LKPIVLVLSLAAFASAASIRVTDALLPRLAAEFDMGIAAAASVITGFTVAYGGMQMAFGPLGDRFGKLRVIALASAAAALATVACFTATGFRELLLARIVAGGMCACLIPLSMAWIGDVVPYGERQPVIARFLIGQIVGIAAGAAIGGFAAESAQWRWPFAALAAWLAAASVALAILARHDPAPRAASSRFLADIGAVLARRWPRIVVATVFVEGVFVFGALAFIPTHLHFVRGLPLARAGLALLAFGAGGVAFALVVRRAVRRFGERGLAVGGTVILAAGLAVVALAPWPAAAAAGCLAAGFGFYMLHNTLQTNGTQMAPSSRGAGMSLFATCFFLGQSAGVALAGAAAQWLGTTPLIGGAALLVLPVGPVFARLLASRPAEGAA